MAQEQQGAVKKKTRAAWWIVGAFVVVLAVVPQLVISLWGTTLLSATLTQALNMPVSVQNVSGGWWDGLEIHGLTIADRSSTTAKRLIEVRRATLSSPIWLALLPGGTIQVAIDGARLELRRQPTGHWNISALQPSRDTELPDTLPLPAGELRFQLTQSQVYLEHEDREYALTAHANSLSLSNEPLEWSIELAAEDGESLAANGSFSNLATPKTLTGSAKLGFKRLDLAVIPALVPRLPVMYPDGTLETGNLQIRLTGFDEFQTQASFDLRNMSLPDSPGTTVVQLPQASIHLSLTRSRNRWTIETLSLEGSHGNLELDPGSWIEIDQNAVHSQMGIHAQLEDTRPASGALAMLLPESLSLGGAFAVKASVDGALLLDSQLDLHERLADLKASFALTLAEAAWRQEQLTNIVARASLDNGRLTVSDLGASVGGGQIDVRGGLAISGKSRDKLSWRITEVELAKALGPPVRAFDIKKATGSLTFDGAMYRLESRTSVRKLNFERQALDDRELRINNADLACGGTLGSDLSQFNISDCQLTSTQGELSVAKGQIGLDGTPKITVDLEGWLSGPFLTALVPELTSKWPQRINVSGMIGVPLTGKIWRNMQWQLDANGKEFAYGGVNFDGLKARVSKSTGQLDFNISGRQRSGSITASGSLVMGDKDVTTITIKANRVSVQRKLKGAYSLNGTISGTADVTIDAEGENYSFLNDLAGVQFIQGRKVVAKLGPSKLAGTLKRHKRGTLWAKQLALTSAELSLKVHDSMVPLTTTTKEAFKVNLDYLGPGNWLTLAAAMAGTTGMSAEGKSRLSLQIQSKPGRLSESLRGKGNLEIPRLSLWGYQLADATADFELHPDGIKITRGLLKYGTGKIGMQGNLILPLERGSSKLALEIEQLPVGHTRTLASFKGGGPAQLTNQTMLDGRVALNGDNGQLALTTDLRTGPISRRLFRGQENLATVELPALVFKSKLVSRAPLRSWTSTAFDLRGDGLLIQLTNGQFRRNKAAYDIAGALAVELSPEFLNGLALDLIPPAIKPTGKITASGQAKLGVPADRMVGTNDVEFHGTLENDELSIEADTIRALRLSIQLAGGRLDITQGEAALLGGRVWLPTPSRINLVGPTHEFNLHVAAKDLQLRTYGGRQVSLGSFLGLLIPVFLFTSDSDKPVGVKGELQSELQLTGTYQNHPGWSRSVNGKGSFRVDDGAVEGSSLISGIIAKSLLMPTNVVHNSVATLFSRDGELGQALTGLGDRAFTFETIASPITVRNGEIFLAKNLMVNSPEMTLTINGHSDLEGNLDYDVGTDLIKRVRLGEITDLPNKIPIIGKAISFLNPFTYLDGIELRAEVTGNLLKVGPDGQSDVHVKTAVIDTKSS